MPRPSDAQVITPQLLRDWPLPEPDGGKEARGTVLVVGGSRFTPGAVLLAGTSALRAGAGRLQLATTDDNAQALSIAVPEAKVVGLPTTDGGSVEGDVPEHLLELAAHADVVAIGPGLDDPEQTAAIVRRVVDAVSSDARLVVDAYALGALGEHPDLLGKHAPTTVLTPNVHEAGRLLGRDPGDDLDAEAAAVTERFGAVVSLYGHVAEPGGGAWRDENADIGLGTSGSGDVLAGIMAGLLARGAEPAQAACWGTYVHAMAGQRLVPRMGRTGYLARELVDEVAATIAMV
ncbi:NAD(P)H-hydrate dehydratase [Aeromicrobium ginsengisoli]|uniref:ADP-dependent (S)-NAD(P)H-hydrate dehydratase n=1 Tax=Aeromicrobium ginsengisoli TaxID=363867 RepID=A0A5M4FHM7_9ACTN|nr:NAD(P)H-hydrate dehydratase [Aeromicrobium ginsengisoli]KAA1399478.1 NAD(P)H-hydrate dehydratase [Aeromicrobium ginsengisoli]